MVKNHLKTMAAPRNWPVKRKGRKFILRPDCGAHSMDNSVSLKFVLAEMLNVAKTKRETSFILNNKEVFVNGIRRKSLSFPIGLFDVVTIKDIKKNYRLIIDNNGNFKAIEISDSDSHIKPCKIANKKIIKGNKTQIVFSDGTNMNIEKNNYSVGDTLIKDNHKNDIKSHLKLEKGTTIFMVGGKSIGELGKVEDIVESKIFYKKHDGEVAETLKKYAFVIGTDKPIIKID